MAFKSLNGLSSMGPVSVIISTPDKTELFSKLFNARDVIHLAHLKTPSYAAHKALNDLYDALPGHAEIGRAHV